MWCSQDRPSGVPPVSMANAEPTGEQIPDGGREVNRQTRPAHVAHAYEIPPRWYEPAPSVHVGICSTEAYLAEG